MPRVRPDRPGLPANYLQLEKHLTNAEVFKEPSSSEYFLVFLDDFYHFTRTDLMTWMDATDWIHGSVGPPAD